MSVQTIMTAKGAKNLAGYLPSMGKLTGSVNELKPSTKKVLPKALSVDTFVIGKTEQKVRMGSGGGCSSYSWHDPNPTGCPGL